MNKVLKNIEKWLLLVLVSYLIIFASALLIENEIGIINSVKVMQYADNLNEIPLEEFSEIAKNKEETFEEIVNSTILTEEQDYSNLKQSMQQNPVGTYLFMLELAEMRSISYINIQSLILGFIIGTGVYLLLDEKERKLLVYGTIYALTIFLLGFLEGIMYTAGWTSIFNCWTFPVKYFLPTTIIFGFILCLIKIKQQGTIRELNKKLIEKKAEEPNDNTKNKEKQTILERTKETREKCARVGMTITTLIMIFTIIIAILFG
jgi:hypothetical protein